VVAGSTHDGEEKVVLDAFIEYKKDNDSALIVVPRHPERFKQVYELMSTYAKEYNLTISKFSEDKSFKTDMILIDAMGELNNIYAISDIAILGGAFKEDVGGHNPLEPAYFGCKIITGKHFFHQKELFKYVKNVQYVEKEDIESALHKTKTVLKSVVDEEIDLEPIINKILET